MSQVAESLIAVNHERGGRTYDVKESPSTFGETIAYVQSVDPGKHGICDQHHAPFRIVAIPSQRAPRIRLCDVVRETT